MQCYAKKGKTMCIIVYIEPFYGSYIHLKGDPKMKRIILIVLTLTLLMVSVSALGEAKLTPNEVKTSVPVKDSYPDNPVVEGESPITGLPVEEEYTPILMVLDNAEDAYPHWGVSDASMMFQVFNAGSGATKILALFADAYPEKAGGARSARMTMLPIANSFNSAFASGNYAPVNGGHVSVKTKLREWGYKKAKKYFDLLGNNFKEREKFINEPHNLTFYCKEAHEYLLQNKVEFEKRPFQFTDEPLTRGEDATKIVIKHYIDKDAGKVNNASYAEYNYVEGKGYTRTSATGVNKDRFTEEELVFANVIVMRITLKYQDGYQYYENHLVGSGNADIFQNGKYISGAWTRKDVQGRLIFTDENGEELKLQRGKTFVVLTIDKTDVLYE